MAVANLINELSNLCTVLGVRNLFRTGGTLYLGSSELEKRLFGKWVDMNSVNS